MRALITGGNGQDGSYLSKFLLSKGYKVISILRPGASIANHRILGIHNQIDYESIDLRNLSSIISIIKKYTPQEIYNLSSQSSVYQSFIQPIETIEYNLISLTNLLEAIRLTDKNIKLYNATSSEMYGNVDCLPIKLDSPMRPLSPYAVSKASCYWIVDAYRKSFGLHAVSGILFNHESILRQRNFFVKKVVSQSVEILNGNRRNLEVGNIDIRRDYGYAPEYVKAMWLMLNCSKQKDYIICSGHSISLREIINYVFNKLQINDDRLIIEKSLLRPFDILDSYGDNTDAKIDLGWNYSLNFMSVLDEMIDYELSLNS